MKINDLHYRSKLQLLDSIDDTKYLDDLDEKTKVVLDVCIKSANFTVVIVSLISDYYRAGFKSKIAIDNNDMYFITNL